MKEKPWRTLEGHATHKPYPNSRLGTMGEFPTVDGSGEGCRQTRRDPLVARVASIQST